MIFVPVDMNCSDRRLTDQATLVADQPKLEDFERHVFAASGDESKTGACA